MSNGRLAFHLEFLRHTSAEDFCDAQEEVSKLAISFKAHHVTETCSKLFNEMEHGVADFKVDQKKMFFECNNGFFVTEDRDTLGLVYKIDRRLVGSISESVDGDSGTDFRSVSV